MAGDTEQLVVQLEARVRDFERNFQRASRVANSEWTKVENRSKRAAKNVETSFANVGKNVSASLSRMASTSIGALTAALGVNQLKNYADGWTSAANKIATAGEETSRVASMQSELADMAIRSRSEFAATVDLYTGLTRSTADLGATQAQVLKATETISKAFAVGGQSASTAAGAIQQLNQAMSAGALRGDELNSVLEGAPPLARLIAREFGVSVGQLKSLGEEGKLTADRVLHAILAGSREIEAEFARTNPTIAQSFQNLDTAITRYIGQADQAHGASSKIAGAINAMATNMDIVAPIAVSLGAALAATFVGGPIVGGITGATTALVLFSDTIRPIAGEIATLGDYARVAFDTLSQMSADAAASLQQSFAGVADLITQSLASVGVDGGQAFELLLQAVKQTANAIIGAFAFAAQTIKATWDTLGFAMAEGIVNAMNAAIQAVEKLANAAVAAVNSITSGINSTLGTSIGQIGNINLRRIENAYVGAGVAAGEAYGSAFDQLTKDHIGNAMGAIGDIGQKWREAANLRAQDRAEQTRRANQANYRPNDGGGSLTAPLRNPAGAAGGGKAKGGAGGKENDFDRAVEQIERRTRAYDAEREAIGKSSLETAKAEAAFRLLEAAKSANIPVTNELKSKIDALSSAYAVSQVALDQAEERQRELQQMGQQFADTLSDAFTDAIVNGERLDKVLQKLLKSLASQLLNKAFGSIFNGLFGSIFGYADGGLITVKGYANGGRISGPGTGRSDSILAAVSNGEFVVNAEATRKNLALLEAINSGKLPAFANGGPVGSSASISSPRLSASQNAPNINQTIHVEVKANGGSPEQNQDLADRVGRQVKEQLRAMVAGEIRTQMRPGGMLSR